MVLGSLFGIKTAEKGKLNADQLFTAGWVFLFGSPVIIILFGAINLPVWAAVILTCLMLVNLDEALMLFYLFSEHGVTLVKDSGYKEWIQEIYSSDTYL